MLGRGLQQKTAVILVFFLWLVKTFKGLLIISFLINKLFSNFQYGFKSSRSTLDFLTLVSDKIASTSDRLIGLRLLDISKAFNRVWYAGFFSQT